MGKAQYISNRYVSLENLPLLDLESSLNRIRLIQVSLFGDNHGR